MIIRLSFSICGFIMGVCTRNNLIINIYIVELVGFEPTSKQGNHTLSTRLSLPLVFEHKQDQSHPLMPYPLNFHPDSGACLNYLRFCCATGSERFGATASE